MSDALDLERLADLLRLAGHTVEILARRQSEPSQELGTALTAIREAAGALDAASERGLVAAAGNEGSHLRAH